MCFETRTVNRAPSSEGNVKHIASRMYGPRSGTMVPDKVPRKVMGGGFRAHSPPRHSLAATGKGISPRNNSLGIRNSADVFDSATPRSGHGGKRKTPNSKDQLILMQEQEAADIEREYIKNLQQQVYYLELELQYTKTKKSQQGGPDGDDRARNDDDEAALPSTQSNQPLGFPVRQKGEPGAGPVPQAGEVGEDMGPYAAVTAVRQAAERACQELQRSRQQQMDEAASRAYDITASHLLAHIERVEAEAASMASAIEASLVAQETQQAEHRKALAQRDADKAALEGLLGSAKEEIALVTEARNRYMDEGFVAQEQMESARADVERLQAEKAMLKARYDEAHDQVRVLTLRAEDAEKQLHENEGSLTADEEQKLQESVVASQLALESERTQRQAAQREIQGLQEALAAQQRETVNARIERDHVQALLEQEKAKRASDDARALLIAAQTKAEHAAEEVVALTAQVAERDTSLGKQRREMDLLRSKIQQMEDSVKVNAELRASAEKRWADSDAAASVLAAEVEELRASLAGMKAQEAVSLAKRSALAKALEEARRDSRTRGLHAAVASAASDLGTDGVGAVGAAAAEEF